MTKVMNDFHLSLLSKINAVNLCKPDDVYFSVSSQYERDSFFYEESGSFLLLIGVCYNKAELLLGVSENWPKEFFHRFQDNCRELLLQIEGYFGGLYYDAIRDELLLFTDHLSTIPIYYFRSDRILVVDTDLFRLAKELRKRGQSVCLSEFGAYSMLAYSFMLDNFTLLDKVYKVRPASLYSCFTGNEEKYFEYYTYEKDTAYSPESIAEGIDILFRRAVLDSFSADGEKSHLVTLSGGLDSRMCLFYALKNGFQDITTLNYSQTFYREETIAKAIAADCHCEHIFFSLDNGNYLANINEGILATQGMSTYRPILSARMIWKKLQMNRFGFVHSGLLGDAILGGYCIEKCNVDDRFHSPLDFAIQLNAKNKLVLSASYKEAYIKLFERILDWISTEKLFVLPSEKYVLDNRYINGLMQSALGTRDVAVLSSPYTGKRLMKYVYSFPSFLRLNHNLYFTWMKKYMPEATNYRWENTNMKPVYGRINVKPRTWFVDFCRWLDLKAYPKKPERSRNPYNYWMYYNDRIQKELYDYCAGRMELLSGYRELMETAQCILKDQNIYMLIRLATLLGFLHMCL